MLCDVNVFCIVYTCLSVVLFFFCSLTSECIPLLSAVIAVLRVVCATLLGSEAEAASGGYVQAWRAERTRKVNLLCVTLTTIPGQQARK